MKATIAVLIMTIYLVAYTMLWIYQAPALLLAVLFLAAPVLLILTVLIILKDDSVPYPELGEDEEWGYKDKAKKESGVF